MAEEVSHPRTKSRRRLAVGLALMPLLLVGCAVAAPKNHEDPTERFRGAEGLDISTSDAEPSWWRDPIVDPPGGANPEPVAEVVVPGDTLFAVDSDIIAPSSAESLHSAIRSLGSITIDHGSVRCHTDDTGGGTYNLDLSNRRAAAVVAELAPLGFDPRIVEASGAGESEPKYDNSTETGRARNRRCEIQLTIVR